MRKRVLKHVLIVLTSAAFGLVAGFVLAVLTSPFWSWFENKTGIESIGHSGPSDWVFELMGALCMIVCLALLEFIFRVRQ
jgi:hypothetical protein